MKTTIDISSNSPINPEEPAYGSVLRSIDGSVKLPLRLFQTDAKDLAIAYTLRLKYTVQATEPVHTFQVYFPEIYIQPSKRIREAASSTKPKRRRD